MPVLTWLDQWEVGAFPSCCYFHGYKLEVLHNQLAFEFCVSVIISGGNEIMSNFFPPMSPYTEPLRGHGWKKVRHYFVRTKYVISFPRNHFVRTKYVISFPRNHFVRTKYVISFPRNHFEGTKYVIKCYMLCYVYVICVYMCVFVYVYMTFHDNDTNMLWRNML